MQKPRYHKLTRKRRRNGSWITIHRKQHYSPNEGGGKPNKPTSTPRDGSQRERQRNNTQSITHSSQHEPQRHHTHSRRGWSGAAGWCLLFSFPLRKTFISSFLSSTSSSLIAGLGNLTHLSPLSFLLYFPPFPPDGSQREPQRYHTQSKRFSAQGHFPIATTTSECQASRISGKLAENKFVVHFDHTKETVQPHLFQDLFFEYPITHVANFSAGLLLFTICIHFSHFSLLHLSLISLLLFLCLFSHRLHIHQFLSALLKIPGERSQTRNVWNLNGNRKDSTDLDGEILIHNLNDTDSQASASSRLPNQW